MKAKSLFFYINLILLLLPYTRNEKSLDIENINKTILDDKNIQIYNNSLIDFNQHIYKQKNLENNDKINISEYNIDIYDYFFNNSELYLLCEYDRILPINFTFDITLEIKYRILEYNEIEFCYQSIFCKKIINTTAYKINEFTNGTYEFYCNYENQFIINESYQGFYTVYIMNITESNYSNQNKFYISYYPTEVFVEDTADHYYYYYDLIQNNHIEDINHYSSISNGLLVAFIIIVLILIIIIIVIISLCILRNKKIVKDKSEKMKAGTQPKEKSHNIKSSIKTKGKSENIETIIMPTLAELNLTNIYENKNLIDVIENQILKAMNNPIIILFENIKSQEKLYIIVESDKTIGEIKNIFINIKNSKNNKRIDFKYNGNLIDDNCKILSKDFFEQNDNKIVNIIEVEIKNV